jgi:hypothetical protein
MKESALGSDYAITSWWAIATATTTLTAATSFDGEVMIGVVRA